MEELWLFGLEADQDAVVGGIGFEECLENLVCSFGIAIADGVRSIHPLWAINPAEVDDGDIIVRKFQGAANLDVIFQDEAGPYILFYSMPKSFDVAEIAAGHTPIVAFFATPDGFETCDTTIFDFQGATIYTADAFV
jgi:hypothetical protein